MDEFYGKEVVITGNVKYVGEGDDSANHPGIIAFERALKETYQPERLNPESRFVRNGKLTCDSLNSWVTMRGSSEE